MAEVEEEIVTDVTHRHEPDYIDQTINTVRMYGDADNSWPQWANIFADEIEDLRAELAARATQAEDYPPGTTRLEAALTENLQAAEAEAARLREGVDEMLREYILESTHEAIVGRLREQLDAATQDRDSARMAAHNYLASFQAAEARCAQLEQERDAALKEAEIGKWPKEAAQEFHRLKYENPRLEARCAQLEQALRFYTDSDDFGELARNTLAGPDTP